MSNPFSDPKNYIIIGCKPYYVSSLIDEFGNTIVKLVPWQRSQISIDMSYNLKKIRSIKHYTDMVCVPDNMNYSRVIGNSYNSYSPLPMVPSEGDCSHILDLFKHIFGEQYELGLDYIELLYWKPKQTLPILLLVSRERNTGKTTFLNFMNSFFGANMVICPNSALSSKFNSYWAGKLIVGIDETFLETKKDTERLKDLSTSKTVALEAKGKDTIFVDNYLKFILASNNINVPVLIEPEETRYWVREVPKLEKDIPNFLEILRSEIPAFMFYLKNRKPVLPEPLSRMWFPPEIIETQALKRIKQMCRPDDEVFLAEALLDVMKKHNLTTIKATRGDILKFIEIHNIHIEKIRTILAKRWQLRAAYDNLSYECYLFGRPEKKTGRYFTFRKEDIIKVIPEFSKE